MKNTPQASTIAAIATAVGGGVAIIRLSGPRALEIANLAWIGPRALGPSDERRMILGKMLDPQSGETGDQAMAVYFCGPRSYTGEDVVEFQCHGGGLSAKATLQSCLRAGALAAKPGEFTLRAFLNGRIDLTQAEAVADLIGAQSDQALAAAERQLDGSLGRRVRAVRDRLSDLHAETEVRLDFTEEDLDWTPPDSMFRALAEASSELQKLLASRRDGEILRDGIRTVIGGPPNAGKSSFLNLLLGRDRAIVTDIPGTTRDTLEESAHIRGIPLRLVDTAGIRDTECLVEKTGIERSRAALREAQLVFWLCDLSRPLEEQLPDSQMITSCPLILVLNKSDLVPSPVLPAAALALTPHRALISARDGLGVAELFDLVESLVWEKPHAEAPEYALNSRHSALLEAASLAIAACPRELEGRRWELLAVHLRSACDSLGEILGETIRPDILDTIFGRYCIGK